MADADINTISNLKAVISSMEVDNLLVKDNISIAEEKKKLGNDDYKAQNYTSALKYYSEAIALCPLKAEYYGNRSACYMMLGDYNLALDDARKAVTIDDLFEKGHIRVAKCCLILGDILGAERAIKKVFELDANCNALKAETQNCELLKQLDTKVQHFYDKKIYRTAIFFLDSALKIAPAFTKYKIIKAECLAFLGRTDEAADIAVNVMKTNHSVDAIFVRGLCLYFSDHLDKCVAHFERALHLDPDHNRCKEYRAKARILKEKRETGNISFKMGKYREAHAIYSESLKIDPSNQEIQSKLHYNRALVNSKLGNLREAIADCDKALEINNQYLKALLLRGRCHSDLDKFEECIKDYEAALNIQKTSDIKAFLREAKLNLKKSKRKDYYKILGITKNATEEEIKKAYRRKALVHHPDRHANSSDIDKKDQEFMFKEVGEAYAILSDNKKKQRYDTGQDLEEDVQEFDPNQMFRHFFQYSGDTSNTFSFQF